MTISELIELAVASTKVEIFNLDHRTSEYTCTATEVPEEIMDYDVTSFSVKDGRLILNVSGYEFGC